MAEPTARPGPAAAHSMDFCPKTHFWCRAVVFLRFFDFSMCFCFCEVFFNFFVFFCVFPDLRFPRLVGGKIWEVGRLPSQSPNLLKSGAAGLAPAANHDPGTSIRQDTSTCCCPGYCLRRAGSRDSCSRRRRVRHERRQRGADEAEQRRPRQSSADTLRPICSVPEKAVRQ